MSSIKRMFKQEKLPNPPFPVKKGVPQRQPINARVKNRWTNFKEARTGPVDGVVYGPDYGNSQGSH